MFNSKIVFLEPHQPPGQLAFGLFDITKPGQRPLVGLKREVPSQEVGVEVTDKHDGS